MRLVLALSLLVTCTAMAAVAPSAEPHKNFRVAVYIPVSIVEHMHNDPQWLEDSWNRINSEVKIDKVYIESYRSRQLADDQTLEQVKKFFIDHGTRVAGGIAYTDMEAGRDRKPARGNG